MESKVIDFYSEKVKRRWQKDNRQAQEERLQSLMDHLDLKQLEALRDALSAYQEDHKSPPITKFVLIEGGVTD